MIDIDRLRSMALTQADGDILVDAANEIERLRATIDQLRSVAGAVSIELGLTFSGIRTAIHTIAPKYE